MNATAIIVLASAFGVIVNTIAVLGVAWRGGRLLGHIDGTLERFSAELATVKDHPQILARITEQLNQLERRVAALERRS